MPPIFFTTARCNSLMKSTNIFYVIHVHTSTHNYTYIVYNIFMLKHTLTQNLYVTKYICTYINRRLFIYIFTLIIIDNCLCGPFDIIQYKVYRMNGNFPSRTCLSEFCFAKYMIYSIVNDFVFISNIIGINLCFFFLLSLPQSFRN